MVLAAGLLPSYNDPNCYAYLRLFLRVNDRRISGTWSIPAYETTTEGINHRLPWKSRVKSTPMRIQYIEQKTICKTAAFEGYGQPRALAKSAQFSLPRWEHGTRLTLRRQNSPLGLMFHRSRNRLRGDVQNQTGRMCPAVSRNCHRCGSVLYDIGGRQSTRFIYRWSKQEDDKFVNFLAL